MNNKIKYILLPAIFFVGFFVFNNNALAYSYDATITEHAGTDKLNCQVSTTGVALQGVAYKPSTTLKDGGGAWIAGSYLADCFDIGNWTSNQNGDYYVIIYSGDILGKNPEWYQISTVAQAEANPYYLGTVTATITSSVISNFVWTPLVTDTTPPVITLLGANPLNLQFNSEYTDPGATALDETDGDITENIVVGGDVVNTNIAGEYVVTYNVSDEAENPAIEVTRTVNVAEAQYAPYAGILNGGVTVLTDTLNGFLPILLAVAIIVLILFIAYFAIQILRR
jgi:hypothetical protein